MKIGILSQWYDPEPGPASLPGVYAREMVARGHTVSALTGFPNYPDGKLHEGYKLRRVASEERDGVDVTRVALYPNHSQSAIGRASNYASFALSATASGARALRGVDAVWVYNSPITVSLPLLAHTRGGRTPFFLHVQDLWPDSLVHSGMVPGGAVAKWFSAIAGAIVRATERRAAVIGVSSRSVRDIILERDSRIDPSAIVYAPNPTNESLFRPAEELRRDPSLEHEHSARIDVMYAGAVGEVQGLDTLLDAAALLSHHAHIGFTVVGDGISRTRLESDAVRRGLRNVRFIGRVPQAEIPRLMAGSDIQLVSLSDAPFLKYTTPSKIAALLASGLPIIGHLPGDGARLIEESGAGITAPPGNAEHLAAAIQRMADAGPSAWREYGARGRAYYEGNLSVASTTETIINSLSGSLKNQSRG